MGLKRLQKSRREQESIDFETGREYGRDWAMKRAEFIDLDYLARQGIGPNANIQDVALILEGDLDWLTSDLEDRLHFSHAFADGFVTESLVVFCEAFPDVLNPAA